MCACVCVREKGGGDWGYREESKRERERERERKKKEKERKKKERIRRKTQRRKKERKERRKKNQKEKESQKERKKKKEKKERKKKQINAVRDETALPVLCDVHSLSTNAEGKTHTHYTLTVELKRRWQILHEMTCFFFRDWGTPNVWFITAFCTGSIWGRGEIMKLKWTEKKYNYTNHFESSDSLSAHSNTFLPSQRQPWTWRPGPRDFPLTPLAMGTHTTSQWLCSWSHVYLF